MVAAVVGEQILDELINTLTQQQANCKEDH